MKVTLDQTMLELTPRGGKGYAVTIGDQAFEVELVRAEDGKLEMVVDGQRVVAYISREGATRWVTLGGQTFVLTKTTGLKRGRGGHEHQSGLSAPMPGQIRAVNVQVGDAVKRGQTLLVVEAMKMELRIQAPQDGVVKQLFVQVGETVEREQLLIEMEAQT
jgi:biotin carboxyl carrier protein